MTAARLVVLLAVVIALVAVAPGAGTAADPRADYIVVLKASAGDAGSVASELARANRGNVNFVYRHALNGFVLRIPPVAADRIARDARVAYVEADSTVSADTTQTGVTAYIIDTGIRYTHTQFGGRAVPGFDAVTSGGGAVDCNGHGTHVAGTVGGSTYGVAKAVTLVGVRVLGCSGSGTTSGVIAGIDWVTGNHTSGPAVANMSLGGGASTALDQAVQNSIADGVAYAIAAGNGNQGGRAQDACKYSPARVAQAMTVSATNSSDTKASWANYGPCVDIFAPGVSITSAWSSSDSATNTISGTSMATPHTAGVAALYLQGNPGASPQQVRDALVANATPNVVKSSSTTNPLLLFTSY
jgi:subtilisin family serine protease